MDCWPAAAAPQKSRARELLAVPVRSEQQDASEAPAADEPASYHDRPLLRRTHVHHRDLRARQRAKAPTHARADRDQDRHLMMLSSLIQHRTEARHFGRLSPGSTPACADQQHWPVIAPQIPSSNVRPLVRASTHTQTSS
jgi:hypothetical protein